MDQSCQSQLLGRRQMDETAEIARGWRIIATTMLGIMVSASVLPIYAAGTFVLPLQAEFGWSRSQIQTAIFFSQAACAVSGLLVGLLLDRLGSRRLAIFGILGVSLSFAFAATASGSLWLFYGIFICIGLLGCGSLPVLWSRVITGHFDRRRGLALGLALTGTGFAGTIIPPLLVGINSNFGWRAGFILLAILPLLTALPAALAWLPRKDQARSFGVDADAGGLSGYSLREAMASYRFWIILIPVISSNLGIAGVLANVIPAMTSKGMSQESAALVQSAYAASLIIGRLFIGWLMDRMWAPAVATMALMPAALGSILLSGEPSFALAVAAIALVGVAAGAELDLLAYLASRYFGLRYFANIYGVLFAGVALAGATGPLAFALIQESTGDYSFSFFSAAAGIALGGLLLPLLGKYPHTLNDVSAKT